MTMTTWTAPQAGRARPELITGERQAYDEWLDFHRATLLVKCAGLTAEQLKMRACPPSPLSLLGLVRHMHDVERWWLRVTGAGQSVPPAFSADVDLAPPFVMEYFEYADFQDADTAADLRAYRDEIEACRAAVADVDLDEVVPTPGQPDRDRNLRWIYLHMIEEYARHNGHADLLRERIDGATGT